MSLVELSHNFSAHARNVLEPAVLTTQYFPINQYNQYFLHVRNNCQCDTVEKLTAL